MLRDWISTAMCDYLHTRGRRLLLINQRQRLRLRDVGLVATQQQQKHDPKKYAHTYIHTQMHQSGKKTRRGESNMLRVQRKNASATH